jgi:hypothetical protein
VFVYVYITRNNTVKYKKDIKIILIIVVFLRMVIIDFDLKKTGSTKNGIANIMKMIETRTVIERVSIGNE